MCTHLSIVTTCVESSSASNIYTWVVWRRYYSCTTTVGGRLPGRLPRPLHYPSSQSRTRGSGQGISGGEPGCWIASDSESRELTRAVGRVHRARRASDTYRWRRRRRRRRRRSAGRAPRRAPLPAPQHWRHEKTFEYPRPPSYCIEFLFSWKITLSPTKLSVNGQPLNNGSRFQRYLAALSLIAAC